MKRLNALFLTAVTLLQSVVSITPTLLWGRLLATGAGSVVAELALAQQAYAQQVSQDGQSFGSNLLGATAGGITSGDATGYLQSVGGYNGAQMTGATGSANTDVPDRNSPGIQQFSCQQQAYLGILGSACAGVAVPATTCQDPNYSSALAALQTNATQAITQALAVCQPVLTSLSNAASVAAANTPTTDPNYAALVAVPGQASTLRGQLLQAKNQLQNVLDVYTKGLPYCDAIVSSDAYTYATQTVSDANAVASACQSLPSSVSASTAAATGAQLTAAATAYAADATASGVRAVTTEMRATAALMATTNNGALNIGGLLGPYASGNSTTLGTNTGNPLVNVLNDPANAPVVSVLNSVLQNTNPTTLVPAGNGIFNACTSATTTIQTNNPQGTVSYPAVTVPATQANGRNYVCQDTSRPSPIAGAPGALWVYIPQTPGLCNGAKAAGTFMLGTAVPYSQSSTSGSTLNLNFSAISDVPASVSVGANIAGAAAVNQTTQVPGGDTLLQGPAGSTAPPNMAIPLSSADHAATVSVSVTLSQPGEFALTLSNKSFSFLATDSTWYTPPTSTSTTQTPGASGGVENLPAPSAQWNQVSCKAAFQCLGTQCHSIMGTQDQSFSNATASMAMLQNIAQNATCKPGTSMATGDCQLDIFKGDASTCRTFLGEGLGLTNNCCNQPINVSPLSTIIKVAAIAYAQGWVPSYGGSLANSLPAWAQSAYNSTSQWAQSAYGTVTSAAGQVWSTVTSPFKGVAESFYNAFGAGGPTSLQQVVGGLTNVTGTGTTATTGSPNPAGATYATTDASGGTMGGTVTGGGNYSGAISMVGSLAGVIGGSLQGVACSVIESLCGTSAAAVEAAAFGAATPAAANAAGAAYTGPVATSSTNSASSMLGSGIVGDIMIAYAIYEIACLIGKLLTQCTNEEMTFYQNRVHRLCISVGNYCASSFLGVCLETTYVGCCYQSMLDRIIMQQLLAMDPGIVPGSTAAQPYGDAKSSPACDGLSPSAIAQVAAGGYFGRLDFSEYLAYLRHSNMLPSTNQEGANWLTPQTNHTTGLVNEGGAPTTNKAIYTGQ